jgi:hypothetical protein
VTEDQHVAKNKGQFKQIKQFQPNIRIIDNLKRLNGFTPFSRFFMPPSANFSFVLFLEARALTPSV